MAGRQAVEEADERAVVLGVRMSPELRTSVKVESVERGLTVALLFEEMWSLYLERKNAGKA